MPMPSGTKKSENEELLVDSTPSLLPQKTLIEKPKSVGVLSIDKESITSVDPRDQTVLSAPLKEGLVLAWTWLHSKLVVRRHLFNGQSCVC